MRELKTNLELNIFNNNKDKQFSFVNKINFNGVVKTTKYFTFVSFNNQNMVSGWKIHLSPLLTNYYSVLKEVNNICENEKIDFKFISSINKYNLFTSKNISSSQFGKIITIYPNDTQQFIFLLNHFYRVFRNVQGMVIPSDHTFNNSTLINYRYGGFNPVEIIDEENDEKSYIFNGNGQLTEDVRKSYFVLPKGIKDPVDKSKASKLKKLYFTGKENKTKIIITKIIRKIASGNVYLGKVNGSHVIIKQAKLGALPESKFPHGTAILLKKNEGRFLKKIKAKYMPQYIDYFNLDNDYFLVESKIEGINLRKFSVKTSLMRPGEIQLQGHDIIKINKVFVNLIKIVNDLHQKDIVLGDISPDNFMVDKNNYVYFIDCETMHYSWQKQDYFDLANNVITKNIKASCSEFEKDNYKLGMTMFWVLTQKNKEINNNWRLINYYLNLLVRKYPQLKMSKDLILQLISPHIIKNNFESQNCNQFQMKIQKQLLDKIHFNGNFLTTPYVKSKLSLINGIAGILLYLNFKNMLNTQDKKRWSSYILAKYNKTQISSGLFFGKMGLAITLAKMGIIFEKNKPLQDLLYKLNVEKINFLSPNLANGISGLLLGFYILSNIDGYPDFRTIRYNLIKSLVRHHNVKENGIEYGKLGILLCISFLNRKDEIFKKYCKENAFLDIKDSIDKLTKQNIKNNTFVGIPENYEDKIIYPGLMVGGAGIILYYLFFDYNKFKMNTLLRLYDVPFLVNNGFSYGVAGFIFPILLGLRFNKFKDKDLKTAKKYLTYWQKYMLNNFINRNNYYGWSSDQGLNIHDDFGSGNTGILMVLNMLDEELKSF